MKTTMTLLAAVLAAAGLAACEKTEVHPPATTVVQPTVEKQVPVPTAVPTPVPVPVQGPPGEKGDKGDPGQPGNPGEQGKTGDTVVVVPDRH
ncbi:MAG: collagen-like protein [Massilia sp.]